MTSSTTPALITFSGALAAATIAFIGVILQKRVDGRRASRQRVLDLIGEQLRRVQEGGNTEAGEGRMLAFLFMQVADRKLLRDWLLAETPDRAAMRLNRLLLDVVNQERKSLGLKRFEQADALLANFPALSNEVSRTFMGDLNWAATRSWWGINYAAGEQGEDPGDGGEEVARVPIQND